MRSSHPVSGDSTTPDGVIRHVGAGENPQSLELLWAPYRMSYITDAPGEKDLPEGFTGEPFLDIPKMEDEDGLIVARGTYVYVVLNLYPYNPGHAMVVPYRRVANLEDLTDEEANELMRYTQQLIRTIRAVSAPAAFTVGLNMGRAAGGSLSQHLHQHVVPRWEGDANFMTILDGVKVLPQTLRETRRLLAEKWTPPPTSDARS